MSLLTSSLMKGMRFLLCTLALIFTVSTPVMAEQQAEKNNTQQQVVQQEVLQLAGADFWRQVKEGREGTTTSGSAEHGVLINIPSETWFILKEKWMSPLAAVSIFGSIAVVLLAYIAVGPLMLSAPRTGRKLKRWSLVDRGLHWGMAFIFLTLAMSGLMLVYAKHFLKPYISTDLWGTVIYLSKQYHNYIGPIFLLLLVAVFAKWWRKSLFKKHDIEWFQKMGGMVGKHRGSHPSADFSNGGEKAIYWLLIGMGLLISISGMVLNFPIFGQTRQTMVLANLVHMFTALVLICGFVFHIYIGLFGMEGALEGMVSGDVDETWAKEHHNLWYQEMLEKGEVQEVNPHFAGSGMNAKGEQQDYKGIWYAYIGSLLTPFTFLISGVIAIVYAGYRLNKAEDNDMVSSHYQGLIRTFFLYLTFFSVLIVTVATANGMLIGLSGYWLNNSTLTLVAQYIPYLGAVFALIAIVVWVIRVLQGMQQLKNNVEHRPSTGPNL